jgi:hypothetical protein
MKTTRRRQGGQSRMLLREAPPSHGASPLALLSPMPAAQNTERAEKGDTEFFQGGASRVPKTSKGNVCPSFSGCAVPSNKRSIQKLSVSPFLRSLRVCAAGPSLKDNPGLISIPGGVHWEGRSSARHCGRKTSGKRRKNATRSYCDKGVRSPSPPPRGGCRPVEASAMGLCLRSGWKGRRGEYCGWPSLHASTGSIRKWLDSFVAGAELRLPRRPTAGLPPSRPLPRA